MGTRLFVGNLPYSAGEDELKRIFEPRWAVVEARIVTDRETGRSRGFGFVELENDQATQEAIKELDGKESSGRRLAIREAHDRQSKPGGGGGGGPRRDRPDVPVEQAPRRPFAPRDDRRPFPPQGERRPFVPREDRPRPPGPPPWEAPGSDWAQRKGDSGRRNERRQFESQQSEEERPDPEGWTPPEETGGGGGGGGGDAPRRPPKGGGGGRPAKKRRDRSDSDW
jgi:RNA recognition motif-containing protein